MRRTPLALRVLGRPRTKTPSDGASGFPSEPATLAFNARASASEARRPGTNTTKATNCSPLTGCGIPTAAASNTAASATRIDSTSPRPNRRAAALCVEAAGRDSRARAGEGAGLQRQQRVPHENPPRDLRAAGVVDDRAAALAAALEPPLPRSGGPGGAGG